MRSEALIVAQPSYAQWEQLPLAARAARELTEGLRKHGYKVEHADLLDGSDKQRADQALADWFGNIGRRVTIVIDGLDEAASGQGQIIAARLIVPLGQLQRVRVLVGSRRSVDGRVVPEGEERHGRLRAVFGTDALIDDLEDEQETLEDVAEYVRLRLTASPKHRNNPSGIAAAAVRVARQADGVFLYARIVSRTLQELDRLDGELPTTALEAFAHDLRARFGTEEQRVDDLLAALAWGEGKGLTRRVWPLVASALAQRSRSYDDDDVAWVLGRAGWHIIEAGEDGQAVYRLGHQALADHYRGRHQITEAQDRIVAALTKGIAGAGWLDCDRYLWRHLAHHAAQADRIGVLIRDPGYLAVAEPSRLVTVLPGIQDEQERRFADIYNRVVDRLIGRSPIDRLPLLHLTAQMEDALLADHLNPPLPTRWHCRWAKVRGSTPYRIIGRHDGPVTALAIATIKKQIIIASGGGDISVFDGKDYSVRLWDALTGMPVHEPLKGHTGRITSIALREVQGSAVIISGSLDCTCRAWNPLGGAAENSVRKTHWRPVHCVALGDIGSLTVAISSGESGRVRFWNPTTASNVKPPISHRRRRWWPARPGVLCLAVGEIDRRTVLVSGATDGSVQSWDILTHVPVGVSVKLDEGPADFVAVIRIDARVAVLAGCYQYSFFRMWDLITGEPLSPFGERPDPMGHYDSFDAFEEARNQYYQPYGPWITCAAMGVINSKPILATGYSGGSIQLWNAVTRQRLGSPLVGHVGPVTSLVIAEIDKQPAVVSGGKDGTVRIWTFSVGDLSPEDDEPPGAHSISVRQPFQTSSDVHTSKITSENQRLAWILSALTGEPLAVPIESGSRYSTMITKYASSS